MSPRIVIVSYNWPPRNAIGTQRPLSWARYWSAKGARVTVLTAKKYPFDAPLDLAEAGLQGVRVIEVPYMKRSPLTAVFRVPVLRKMLVSLKKRLLGARPVTDLRARWWAAARDVALELAGDTDFVISSHGPSAAHLIAADMKRANPRIGWVADYRDPWHDNVAILMSARERARQRELELQTVALADEVTTVSTELAERLSGFLGREVRIVENGFDVPERVARERLATVRRPAGRPRRIIYTGMVYPKLQDAEPLFAALARMKRDGGLGEGDLVCDFYGNRLDSVREVAAKPAYRELVRFHGHVRREQSLQAQQDADLLLILETPTPGVVPAKVFEYLASGRPILSIGPSERSATAELLDYTGTGRSVGGDEDAMIDAVEQILRGENPSWYAPDPDRVAEFSRERRAEVMFDILLNSKHGVSSCATAAR